MPKNSDQKTIATSGVHLARRVHIKADNAGMKLRKRLFQHTS